MDKHDQAVKDESDRIVELGSGLLLYAERVMRCLGDLDPQSTPYEVIFDLIGWTEQLCKIHKQDPSASFTQERVTYQIGKQTEHLLNVRLRRVADAVKLHCSKQGQESYRAAVRHTAQILKVMHLQLKRVQARDSAKLAARSAAARRKKVSRAAATAARKRAKKRTARAR